jgi:DNA-directed RNA polymerase specialized sigma24 family protein
MAVMLTGNRADAEDLLQAALVKTYRSWSKINDRAALDAYVRHAMVNTHISWWRRRRVDEYPTDELPDQVVADHARVYCRVPDSWHYQVCRSGGWRR